MGESGCGYPADLAVAAGGAEIPTLEATLTIDSSPPNVIVDESSLGEHRDKNAENLKLRLGMRRDLGTLVSQGIMPPMHSPQAFFEQKQRLERAVISDRIKAKLQRRPARDVLVQQHILEEAGNYVDPSLVEKHKQLKRARLADQLNRSIMDRPGPLEVIEAGILHVDDSLENDVKDGKIQFRRTCEGALHVCPLRPFIDGDDEGAAAPPNAVAVQGLEELSPPPSASSQSSQSPRAQIHPYKSESVLAEFSPPSSGASNDSVPLAAPSTSLPVSRCASMPVFVSKETSTPTPTPAFVTGARSIGKMSQRSAGGGKARAVKNKSNGSQQQKQKMYTFHVYHGPSSAQHKKDLLSKAETKYEILVQQQQTILQYELESQQKRLLPSTTRPKSSESSSSSRRNSQSTSESSGPKSLSKMEDMKVQDLKIEAKMRGLPVSGTKAQLIERLQPYADVSTSAALGSVSTSATSTVSAVVANQSPISCFSLPVYAATSAPATAVIAVKPAEAHLDETAATFASPAHLDQDMPTPLSMPMDIDDAMPLTAVSLTPVFSTNAGGTVPVILNVNPADSHPVAELALLPPPPPPPPLPTTTLARSVNVVVNVPVVNVPVALPLGQQPIVAITAAPSPAPVTPPQPQFADRRAQDSQGMIHEIMNQFKELKEQLDNSDSKPRPSEVPKVNFRWPTQPEERSASGLKMSWKLGPDQTLNQMSFPSTASSSFCFDAFAKPILQPASVQTLPWQQHAAGSFGTFGSGLTFSIGGAEDENPNVSEIQPSLSFDGDGIKSQLVDDIISIAVKNGDLPPRAANDILTPTPERMESRPSFPVVLPRSVVGHADDSNNNGGKDALSPMNDENSNVDTTPPPPTPPPLPAQQLGVSLMKSARDDPNVEMSASNDAADFQDFLSILGNTAQSASACDFFSDMDLSLLDNCGNLGGSTTMANQPPPPPLPPAQHQQQPKVRANGFVLPAVNPVAGVNVGSLLDSWATAASSLSADPPVFPPSEHFDAQAWMDCWTPNVP